MSVRWFGIFALLWGALFMLASVMGADSGHAFTVWAIFISAWSILKATERQE